MFSEYNHGECSECTDVIDADHDFDTFPKFRSRTKSLAKLEHNNRPRIRKYSGTEIQQWSNTPTMYSTSFDESEDNYHRIRRQSSSSGSEAGNVEGSIPIPRQVSKIRRNLNEFSTTYYTLCHSMENISLDHRSRSITRPRSCNTVSNWTQTPPLEQVLVEMRMERDLRAETGDHNWISTHEKEGNPDWKQLGREMRYLADDWKEYSEEKRSLGRSSSEKSIWRSLVETFFYEKPKTITPSMNRKAISMGDLKTDPLPRASEIQHSRSLTNSQTCFSYEKQPKSIEAPKIIKNCPMITYEQYPDNQQCQSHQQRTFNTRELRSEKQKYRSDNNRKISKGYGTFSNNVRNEFSGGRKRSQSFSCTGVGCASHKSKVLDNDEVDLDHYLTIPHSEQFKKEHYSRPRTFSERKEPNMRAGKMSLQIPQVKSTFSDDDDITPKVKYVNRNSINEMFKKSDHEYYEDDFVFQ